MTEEGGVVCALSGRLPGALMLRIQHLMLSGRRPQGSGLHTNSTANDDGEGRGQMERKC